LLNYCKQCFDLIVIRIIFKTEILLIAMKIAIAAYRPFCKM